MNIISELYRSHGKLDNALSYLKTALKFCDRIKSNTQDFTPIFGIDTTTAWEFDNDRVTEQKEHIDPRGIGWDSLERAARTRAKMFRADHGPGPASDHALIEALNNYRCYSSSDKF